MNASRYPIAGFAIQCVEGWKGSMARTRAVLDAWRLDYNAYRPHSRLGWMTPSAYAETLNPQRDRSATLLAGSAARPVAHAAQLGSTELRIPAAAG
ncbi:MAG: transposase [Alphaproteobacteria bacterium]|nr:transposase [Alphaproteobacteria bacterium]